MAKRGGVRKPAGLIKPIEAYEMSSLRNPSVWSEKELRKEYSRLRSIARKRLERLKAGGYDWASSYRENVGKFKPIKDVSSRRELESLTRDVSRFITAKSGSARGLREIQKGTISTLREHGYTGINEQNFRRFGEYMEYLRDMGEIERGTLSSERAVDLFRHANRLGISEGDIAANFDFWEKNVKALEKATVITPDKNGVMVNSANYAVALNIKGHPGNQSVNIGVYERLKREKSSKGFNSLIKKTRIYGL